MNMKGSVVSPANIAMIKHWGLVYQAPYNLPLAGSFSFNLSGCTTHTTAQWVDADEDQIFLNGVFMDPKSFPRAEAAYAIVERARTVLGMDVKKIRVETKNSFPTAAGIASSASGFSALAGACLVAGGVDIKTPKGNAMMVDVCAYGGSISALRSCVDGWSAVKYDDEKKCFEVVSFAKSDHWDIFDLVVVLQEKPKKHGSADGHASAANNPLQTTRIEHVKKHLECMPAIVATKDFVALGKIAQKEARMMVDVMRSGDAPIEYTVAQSWVIIESIEALQKQGVPVFWTIDAGANPHVIVAGSHKNMVENVLKAMDGVRTILVNTPCIGTRVTENHLF